MRAFCLAGLAVLALPGILPAQAPPVKVEGIRLGFRPNAPDGYGRFKTGLWAPVYVDLTAGPRELSRGELVIETNDADALKNEYSVPVQLDAKQSRTFVSFVRPGDLTPRLTISLRAGGEKVQLYDGQSAMAPGVGEFLYVTLGTRCDDLQKALLEMTDRADATDTSPRWAGYEERAELLPPLWFGYDGVDLIILTTDGKAFLDGLKAESKRWLAVGEWVRQRGRLLISVSPANSDRVRDLLAAWKPALPNLLPPGPPEEYERMASVEAFAGVREGNRFPGFGQPAVRAVKLASDRRVEVLARQDNKEPLLVRVPYGRGSVALFALDLDRGPVAGWSGRKNLWQALLAACGPRSKLANRDVQAGGWRNLETDTSRELGSTLQVRLDEFEMTVISFGWVALFIFLYILVVGPLDYLILKKVFRRLEWTWVTFPVTVLVISVVAYFTAYAVKGNDLKINKVDLVDIDQRSDLDAGQRSRPAYAYGTTWWTLFSPRIQSYTLGIEPAVADWLGGERPEASVMTTWMGRADAGGLGSVARPRSQSLFRRTYEYGADAAGLKGVPIAVWTTKSFTSAWSTPLPGLAVEADLYYVAGNPDQVEGTVRNKLPFELKDAGVLYLNRFFPLDGPLVGKADRPVAISRDPAGVTGVERWAPPILGGQADRGSRKFDATAVVQTLCFHEAIDLEKHWSNHSFRRLDESWRLADKERHLYQGTREAILFARIARSDGVAEQVNADAATPTRLWLGELPGGTNSRPALAGSMIQDTYVRIFLPVRAKAPPKQ